MRLNLILFIVFLSQNTFAQDLWLGAKAGPNFTTINGISQVNDNKISISGNLGLTLEYQFSRYVTVIAELGNMQYATHLNTHPNKEFLKLKTIQYQLKPRFYFEDKGWFEHTGFYLSLGGYYSKIYYKHNDITAANYFYQTIPNYDYGLSFSTGATFLGMEGIEFYCNYSWLYHTQNINAFSFGLNVIFAIQINKVIKNAFKNKD